MVTRAFVTGVGIGDVRKETDAYFKRHYPGFSQLHLLPHNQFLFVFAGAGLFGFLYFLLMSVVPMVYRDSASISFLVAFHIMILTSYMVEHTIETQIGTALYITFALLGIKYVDIKAEMNG